MTPRNWISGYGIGMGDAYYEQPDDDVEFEDWRDDCDRLRDEYLDYLDTGLGGPS